MSSMIQDPRSDALEAIPAAVAAKSDAYLPEYSSASVSVEPAAQNLLLCVSRGSRVSMLKHVDPSPYLHPGSLNPSCTIPRSTLPTGPDLWSSLTLHHAKLTLLHVHPRFVIYKDPHA